MPSIVSVSPISGREADFGNVRDMRLRRAWRIVTDSRFYSEAAVLQDAVLGFGLPIPFVSVHPDNPQFLCKRLRGKQEKDAPLVWMAEAHYDTVPAASDEEQPPLDRRAKITWTTKQLQVAVEKTVEATPQAVVNSNGLPFSPPAIKQLSQWVAVVSKNVSVVPADVLNWRDKLNSGTFTVDGIAVARHVAKLSELQVSDWKKEGDTEYRTLQFALHFDETNTWHGRYLYAGLLQKSGSNRIACVDEHGCPVRSPVPLDANGVQIAKPIDQHGGLQRFFDLRRNGLFRPAVGLTPYVRPCGQPIRRTVDCWPIRR